jgi:dihydrofolate reductase
MRRRLTQVLAVQRAAQEQTLVELVVAVAENDVIGRGNTLPWRLPADLRRFKATTLGHCVLMGRKTYDSIGKALPGRRNLVLTRSADFSAAECTVVRSIDDACRAAGPGGRLMVIGGAEVYRLCLALASRIHLTIVHTRIAHGDARFDGWRGANWRESRRERFEKDDQHAFDYSFVTLERA